MTMSQWWVSRLSSAIVILASPNTLGHSSKARFLVTMIDVRSYNLRGGTGAVLASSLPHLN
jgi:hypothetical protein